MVTYSPIEIVSELLLWRLSHLPLFLAIQEKEEELDEEDRRASATAKLDLQAKALLLLGQAWPTSESTQSKYYGEVVGMLVEALPMNNWKLQVAILSSLASVYERLV